MKNELEEIFIAELEKNKDSLLRVCAAYATDSEMKKDYFQESILNIWKSLPSFNEKSSLKTWMYKITVNVCLGMNKKRMKFKSDFIEIIKEENKQRLTENENPRLDKLHKCISNLNTSDKTIVSLFLEELPYKDIANITGLTENYVAVKMKRIKIKLLNCINQTK